MQPIGVTDPAVLDAILGRMMMRESHGNPNAKGKNGEIGLFQIKPETALMYGISPDLAAHPEVNRYIAKRYLGDLIKHFGGDVGKGVAAYNTGPGNVAKGKIPQSTKDYVADVTRTAPSPTPSGAAPRAPISFPLPQGLRTYGIMPMTPEGNTLEIPSRSSASSSTLEIPSRAPAPPAMSGVTPSAPASTSPLARVLSSLGPASASAAEPEEFTGDPRTLLPIRPAPAPFTGDPSTLRPLSKLPDVTPPSALLPQIARSFPAIGQFIGEGVGGLGTAAIPGVGESGVAEWMAATGLGAAGSAGGAKLENMIDQAYGMPPQASVGKEALWGAATSGIGNALPLIPRFRAAARVGRDTAGDYIRATGKVTGLESDLSSKVGGMTADRADQLLKHSPAPDIVTDITRGPADTLKTRYDLLETRLQRVGLQRMRKDMAASIFQKAGASEARNPAMRMAALKKAVEDIDTPIFERVYGKGSQKEWLTAADGITKLEKRLLQNPTQAKAVNKAIRAYLERPGMIQRLSHRLGHRVIFDLLVFGGGAATGHLPGALATLGGLELFEAASRSRPAVWALSKAAGSQSAQEIARLLIAAVNASDHAIIQEKITGKPGADNAP